jgi:DNA invertase Pin-like site-specific DNA recombinase
MQNNPERYRGKRALILTRVSTREQEKKYSHAAQERQVREKLIIPLGLRIMDEKKHIIHDTYSGLEYRYRKALDDILNLAQNGEFDVLCMDVLDRGLGRRALARELFRMQLKELGISILTTQESDHADDDSLEGQIMRFFKGVKAEEEINDFVRRSRDGKREKTLGSAEKPGQVLGTGMRLYGYQFVLNEKGVRVGYAPNDTIIHVEADGTEWTEVKVVIYIFESAAMGVSTHQLARTFNEKGIPTSYAFRGKCNKGMREDSVWQRNTISQILKNTAYYGEYRQFKTATVGRRPGSNRPIKQKTPEDKQVIILIPAIITKDLFEKANKRNAQNRIVARRNYQGSKDCLLRGGFAKCASCGQTLYIRHSYPEASADESPYYSYDCGHPQLKGGGKCPGCSISVDYLDSCVAEYILELIRDPSVVDEKIEQLQAENPAQKQQQRKLKNLNTILREQETFRNNLAAEMRKKAFSERTVAFLNTQLTMLEQQEEEARRDLADEQRVQEQHETLSRRIAEFHRQCQDMHGAAWSIGNSVHWCETYDWLCKGIPKRTIFHGTYSLLSSCCMSKFCMLAS